MRLSLLALAAASCALSPALARADLSLSSFTAGVLGQDITYTMEACESVEVAIGAQVSLFYDLSAPPGAGTVADESLSVSVGSGVCQPVTFSYPSAPVGLYRSYAAIAPAAGQDADTSNNLAGPLEVCVGPDVVVTSLTVQTNGAAVTYVGEVCNQGSLPAAKFRVGFWHDRASAPPQGEMGNIFHPVTLLPPGECEEFQVDGGLRPNGSFTAWGSADSGDFVGECREANNPIGPYPYSLSNPDLEIASFTAAVAGGTVTYEVRVCNRGTASVSKFYVDVYFDRPKLPPGQNQPGDMAKAVLNLGADECADLSFQRTSTPKGDYVSFVQADADDFFIEPNEANNLSLPLTVQVGEGGTSIPDGGIPLGPCLDSDGDGYGVGEGCQGVPDCNDNDLELYPGAEEICGNGIDEDCDLTPDDGCPDVDCTDGDGDSFGVGADCVLADCDDSDPKMFPWAKEVCGDNKDDNCNGIADDGCLGRQCVDRDSDGFGEGQGCPGPADCDDSRFWIKPDAEELCGDGRDDDCDGVPDDGCQTTVDSDSDSYSVGQVSGQPDCDDTNATIHPGAEEICGDGVDNNCNGTVDDGCLGVACVDGDGDGWGVGIDCVVADLDDEDPQVHPWAEEICGDGIDNDGDGTVDDGCEGVDCVDADGDSWGVGADCVVADCDDSEASISPWRPERCNDGKDNNCDGNIDEGCLLCEDKDGDGHGIGPGCTSWDCDDNDETVHPGAAEICNGKDNNCNELADDDCSGSGDEGCGCQLQGDGDSHLPALLFGLLLLSLALAISRRRRQRSRT